MNFFAVIVLIANPQPHTNLFVSGPWKTEAACTEQVEGVTSDNGLSKILITSGCVPESDLPKVAEMAKKHDCTFAKREELQNGVDIAVFNCNK